MAGFKVGYTIIIVWSTHSIKYGTEINYYTSPYC